MVEGISKHDNEGPKIINVTERIYDITDDTINVSVTIEFNSDIYLRKPNTIPPLKPNLIICLKTFLLIYYIVHQLMAQLLK